jgi:ubiquinone/menaquinone biosynthesis C-methylase UbiE
MFLNKRSYKKEIMDDFSIQDERIDDALNELHIINILLGGSSATRQGLTEILKNFSLNGIFKVADIGAGGSDVFNFKKQGINIQLISIDKNIRALKYIKNKNPDSLVVCADALQLPLKPKSIDLIHTSLFLHHFNDHSINKLLVDFKKAAKRGIIINDLRRSVLALWGITLLTKLFSKSDMVTNDGPLSVKRSFRRKEINKLINQNDFSIFRIKRKWAFRWLIYGLYN